MEESILWPVDLTPFAYDLPPFASVKCNYSLQLKEHLDALLSSLFLSLSLLLSFCFSVILSVPFFSSLFLSLRVPNWIRPGFRRLSVLTITIDRNTLFIGRLFNRCYVDRPHVALNADRSGSSSG